MSLGGKGDDLLNLLVGIKPPILTLTVVMIAQVGGKVKANGASPRANADELGITLNRNSPALVIA